MLFYELVVYYIVIHSRRLETSCSQSLYSGPNILERARLIRRPQCYADPASSATHNPLPAILLVIVALLFKPLLSLSLSKLCLEGEASQYKEIEK
jgi:hypothetical protein